MYAFKHKASVENIIDEVSKRAEFSPTTFKIYDRSTADICNRLIVVAPFDWYIWACRGELYILNPEGGIKCAANTTPAIQVLSDQFLETCLKLDLNSILDTYVNGKIPYVVPYEITTTTFTILSALNILMQEYITFDIQNSNTGANSTLAAFSRMKHLTIEEISSENAESTQVSGFADRPEFRVLSAENVINITSPKIAKNLLHQYTKHTSQAKPQYNNSHIFNSHELDVSHSQYITLRQHAMDAHNNYPKMILSKPNIGD